MNTVILTGKLNFEAKVMKSKNGKAFATFMLNVYQGKDKDGKNFYRNYSVKVFNEKYANALANIAKGSALIVAGKSMVETYEKDGKTQFTNHIYADFIGTELQ